jgi:hypothetical protein
MTATESLLPEIINDFFNKIGTLLTRAKPAACPHLADADIRVLNEESGFDSEQNLAEGRQGGIAAATARAAFLQSPA